MTDHTNLLEQARAVLGPHDDMPENVQRNLMVYTNMWLFREMTGAIEAQAARIKELEAERDTARAESAMAYEVAAKVCDDTSVSTSDDTEGHMISLWFKDAAREIRSHTPAHAPTALAARDAQMRAEGRNDGLREAAEAMEPYFGDALRPASGWTEDYTLAWQTGGLDHLMTAHAAIRALITPTQETSK